jgi:hypothetical protein
VICCATVHTCCCWLRTIFGIVSLLLKIMEDNRSSASAHSLSSSTYESSYVPLWIHVLLMILWCLIILRGLLKLWHCLKFLCITKTVAQSILPSTQPTSCMHLRLFPSLNPGFYNFCLHVPLDLKKLQKLLFGYVLYFCIIGK